MTEQIVGEEKITLEAKYYYALNENLVLQSIERYKSNVFLKCNCSKQLPFCFQ